MKDSKNEVAEAILSYDDLSSLKLSVRDIIEQMNYLQGKILTILEASISTNPQLKASKDLVKDAFSERMNWIPQLAEVRMKGKHEILKEEIVDTSEETGKLRSEMLHENFIRASK